MPDLIRELVQEIASVHPYYSHRGKKGEVPGWTPLTKPEPCELCGTRVVAFRNVENAREVRVVEIGRVIRHRKPRPSVSLPLHSRDRCRRTRNARADGDTEETRP